MKRGKRYVDSAKKIDRTVQYESADAIKLVKEGIGYYGECYKESGY